MDFASDEQQLGWRHQCLELFANSEVKLLDPTRRPHDCGLTSKEIFQLDIIDVKQCDLVLVDNRNLGIPVFGTPCEVFYASHILGKPVIAWHDKDHAYKKSGVFQDVLFTREFESLEEAADHIRAFYL